MGFATRVDTQSGIERGVASRIRASRRAIVVSCLACVLVSRYRSSAHELRETGFGGGAMDGQCWDSRRCDWLPVLSVTTVARCRWPSTRNCGSCTSLLIPTLDNPSFQWYRISLIVYPTPETCQTHKTLSLTLRSIAYPSPTRPRL